MLKEIEALTLQLKEEQQRASVKKDEAQTLASTNIVLAEVKSSLERVFLEIPLRIPSFVFIFFEHFS